MPLTKTIAEIKEVLPKLVSSISNNTLLPNFDRAEYKYIVSPIIGPALYSTLSAAYNSNSLTDKQLQLVKHIRLVAAAYAYRDELGMYSLTLSDGGVKKISQVGAEPLRAWEVQRLENTLVESALDGTEVLINYLVDNKADFTDWTSSDQYKKVKVLLLASASEFNEQYTLFRPQRSYFTMRTVMRDVQRFFLEETIGADLLEYLRDKSSPTDKETACIDLLKKSLAFFTISKACKHFSVSFSDNGFTILGEKNTSSPEPGAAGTTDLELLEMKIDECEKDANSYLEKANAKLVALYADTAATADYKAAFAKGPLSSYIDLADRTSGNEKRKIFRM